MTRARLPLTVIGGFLGAGKTTLLNHWLRETTARMAVLVNDFGALNIDASLIASNAGDTVALTNGCVCCSIGDDLTGALIRVLEAPTPFDAVVIEASGVSDPWRIAQVGLVDPGLSLDGVIVLVDAGAVLEQSRDPLLADSLARQVKAADLVVINQCDRVADTAPVHAWVASVAGTTPRVETTQGVVPLPMLSGLALAAEQPRARHGLAERSLRRDHGATFDTWSLEPSTVLSAQALRALLRDMPAGVLRLKGLVQTDEHGWAELQFAGRHGSLRRAMAPPTGGAAVMAIGLRGRLPAAALEASFSLHDPNGLRGLGRG